MVEEGAGAAAAAAAGVEVAVVVAAVSAQAGAGAELGAAGHYERWTETWVVAQWGALSRQDLQMQRSSFSLPEVTPAGIFPC